MASTGQPAAAFQLDDAVATPSCEWAEVTRAALEDKTTPVGTGTFHTAAVPGGTALACTLPAGANFANTTPSAAPTGTGNLAAVQPPTPHVPGAYPCPHEAIPNSTVDTGALAQDVHQMIRNARKRLPAKEDLKQAAQDMAQTAATYAQTAASYLPQSLSAKFADYLPTAKASENDASHDKSPPTQEIHGALPGEKVGGAGALPGGVDEDAVAKLPGDDAATGLPEGAIPTLGVAAVAGAVGYEASGHDEPHDNSLPTQEAHGTQPGDKAGGVGALPDGENENEVGVAAALENASDREKTSLPTEETQGDQPGEKVGGVGALPGIANETGVAKLPGNDAAAGLPEGSKGAAVGAVVATSAAVTATSAAPTSGSTSSGFKVPARPEDMFSKSHVWPDARSHSKVSKDAAVTTDFVGANDKRDDGKKEILIPVAKGEGGKVSNANAALAPAKPEGLGKDTTADDKVRTTTSPPAQLEPRKWRSWKGVSAPGEMSEKDLDLAENDVGELPLNQEAYARDLEAQGASLDAEHGKAKPSDTHSHSDASAHTEGSKDEAKHKASFMEKVKGEMKIVSGKLGGHKEQVEEGKKLKSGQA